ncbi:ABC transporter substrate-binding protein [Rhodobacterales bacterium HKCCE2091]|nr:ABC transporter substrate-binding protein [Rhodobacterales bacterium HKCCE2091]
MAALAALASAQSALADIELRVIYLRQEIARPPVLSDLDPVPADEGTRGAELAIAELATTGGFLGHSYSLDFVEVPQGGDLSAAAAAALDDAPVILIEAPADAVAAVSALPGAAGAILFNVAAPDPWLRDAEGCRANLFHTIPAANMRADALMQYLTVRRWTDLALIEGPFPADAVWADALRASAEKFGLRLREDMAWDFDGDLGRTAQAEIPILTQGFAGHDVLLVADETGDFGRYVLFNTWEPRPVGGSEGIVPVAWAPVLENWGASQLQNRFADLAERDMRPVDYAAWAAVRAVGEAVTRTGSADPATLRDYMLSDTFALDGFKGRPLSFRPWDGQLRQPIPVVSPRAMLAMAPFDAFLHAGNELDTLGTDAGESTCTAFGG